MAWAFGKKRRAGDAEALPPEQKAGQPLTYRTASLQGVGRRERQEDSFAFANDGDPEKIRQQGLLCVVADGMGGLADGKDASETAIASLLSDFSHFDPETDFAEQLNEAVNTANRSVYRKLGGKGGSTVVTGLIVKERLYCSSVGDSYIFLLHDRRLFRLNRSQNVLNRDWLETIREGELDPDTAKRNPEKDAITQFLGMDELDEIDYFRRPLKLTAGDVLLFCSDGVGGVLSPASLTDCLSYGSPEDMVRSMELGIKTCNLSYQDNYTALVVQCRG